MKYFVFALCIAAASAFVLPPTVSNAEAAEIQQIIDAIYHPSTDPATAAALEQMLLETLGIKPVIVEDHEPIPIEVSPEIIDESIIVEPGQNEGLSPIDVGPAIIDESIVSEPANYRPPLVQVIVNVNTYGAGNAVVVQKPENPEVDQVDEVTVVEEPEIPEQIIVAPVIIPEQPVDVPTPVIVNPIEQIPAVNLPGILN